MNNEDFLGGPPALSFKDEKWLGVKRGGRIIGDPVLSQIHHMETGAPLVWKDGSPKMQMIATLRCDGSTGGADERTDASDSGDRRLYIKSGLVAAVREAVHGASDKAPTDGGTLLVVWTSSKPAATKGYNDAKIYAAKYTKPDPAAIPRGGEQSAVDPWGTAASVESAAPFVAGASEVAPAPPVTNPFA